MAGAFERRRGGPEPESYLKSTKTDYARDQSRERSPAADPTEKPMKRRDLLLGMTTTAAMLADAEKSVSAATAKSLGIEAPDDVQVLYIEADGPITQGQKLFELKSFHVDALALQIDLFRKHVEILERPFNDGRIEEEKKLLHAKADLLKEIMIEAKSVVDRRNQVLHLMFGQDVDTMHLPSQDLSQLQFVPMPGATAIATSHSALNGQIINNDTFASGGATVGQPLDGQITNSLTKTTSNNWT